MPLSRITSNGLTSQSITAGTYGGANNVPVVTVGADGRISAVANSQPGFYLDTNSTILRTNTNLIANTTIPANTGGLTVGPVYVANNITLTVAANARYVVV